MEKDIELTDLNILICGKCRNKNEIYLIFCKKCGKEFTHNNDSDEILEKNDAIENDDVYNSPKTIFKKIIYFSIVIIIVLIVGLIIKGKQQKQELQGMHYSKLKKEIKNMNEKSNLQAQEERQIKQDSHIQNNMYTMYVNSSEGLRVRNSPNLNGEKIGLLEFFTAVKIIREDNNSVNIDGINGKWVYIKTPIEGWVFDGYLSEVLPLEIPFILGVWENVENSDIQYYFLENNTYIEYWAPGSAGGTWQLEGNTLILSEDRWSGSDDYRYENCIKGYKYLYYHCFYH
jgi:hypothetical protein